MGWKLKALAFVLAVFAASAGAWVVALPLLVYVFWGVVFGRKRKPTQVVVNVRYPDQSRANLAEAATAKASAQAPEPVQGPPGQLPGQKRGLQWRLAVGGLLLLLSLVAVSQGGTFSPIVFAGVGLTLLLWGRIRSGATFATFRPVRESVLMRSPSVPFLWFALAEVKFATRSVATALASIDERIVITSYETPTVYVLFRAAEATHSRAETRLLEKMREVEMTIAPLGAYLLPVDSESAVDSLGYTTKHVKVDPDAMMHSLFTLPYETLSLTPKEGRVASLGLFVRGQDRRGRGQVVIPAPRQTPSRPPMLWETLRLVESKLRWPVPDAETAFLSSLFATREEDIGGRIIEAASPPDAQRLLLKSLGGPQVELTRAQLRALVRVYSWTLR